MTVSDTPVASGSADNASLPVSPDYVHTSVAPISWELTQQQGKRIQGKAAAVAVGDGRWHVRKTFQPKEMPGLQIQALFPPYAPPPNTQHSSCFGTLESAWSGWNKTAASRNSIAVRLKVQVLIRTDSVSSPFLESPLWSTQRRRSNHFCSSPERVFCKANGS